MLSPTCTTRYPRVSDHHRRKDDTDADSKPLSFHGQECFKVNTDGDVCKEVQHKVWIVDIEHEVSWATTFFIVTAVS